MNTEQREEWIDEVIQEVLAAIAHAPELREVIIFKGAWILNAHLRDNRHSMDIDANAATDWATATPELEKQRAFFEKTIQVVVNRIFEKQNPVRFNLRKVSVKKNPLNEHPRSWTAFKVKLTIADAQYAKVLGLPAIEMDIAAPERLGPEAVEMVDLLGAPAKAYSLHRIAGEKLRAYLSSLPEYRRKIGGGERSFRTKDLFDLTRILRAKPIIDHIFWKKAGSEFALACESRLVDCMGLQTFKQEWEEARSTYESDAKLNRIRFADAEAALTTIVHFLKENKFLPLSFPISD